MQKPLSREELLKISASLENYHIIFYKFWEMSAIYFSDDVPTAAIQFNSHGGKPEMIINEDFWNRHNHREKLFIVCHEGCHVMLDHGIRNGMKIPGATPLLVNKAQDIAINHMIIDLFNYDREDLREWKKYCWIETCFTNPQLIKRNETYLYYLEELIKDPKSKEEGGPIVFDSHNDSNTESETNKKHREIAAKEIADNFNSQELEDLIKNLPEDGEGGTIKGVYEAMLKDKLKKLKLNFKLMINKLKRTKVSFIEKDIDTFVRENRRFDDIMGCPDISLPGTITKQSQKNDRLLTVLFMDVSGSCMNYFHLFQQAAEAFDAEREIFDLRLFVFDTSVSEIKIDTPFRVGGGTYYHILEQKVLELEKEYHRYPDCIIVLTDGDGSMVKPKKPTKWIWLLTPPATKTYIPVSSRQWAVDQVEFT